MKTKFFLVICFVACLATFAQAQRKSKVAAKPVTTQAAKTEDGREVILRSDGTWIYDEPEPPNSSNVVTLTGKCRFQLVSGFFPCNSKVLFTQVTDSISLLSFGKTEKGKVILFTLSGRADRQPNLENYFLQIDTFRIDGIDEDGLIDSDMEGECHFRMNKSATNFFSVKCDIYNRSKGTMYNFYLENIIKTNREVIK